MGEILFLIFFILCGLTMLYCFYMLRRNDKVCDLLIQVLTEHGNEGYERMPSYAKLLYSFKPLNIKYWREHITKNAGQCNGNTQHFDCCIAGSNPAPVSSKLKGIALLLTEACGANMYK